MHTVALFGAGKIGEAITAMLSSSGRYHIKVCDHDLTRARAVASQWPATAAHQLDLTDTAAVQAILTDCQLVISALPFFCNVAVAAAAASAKVHYVDLTEDVESARAIATLAANTPGICFMPQCGLAPGFVSIAAHHLVQLFETIDSVKMRVGALPIYPTNRLKYNLTWSTDGLINEYCNLCEVIQDGQRLFVLPLEGYEHFSLDGAEYEAFNTSGGLGTMCDTLAGKVRELNYKSIRYPGHRELVAFMLQDLRFRDDRADLKRIFERAVTTTAQDKCLILVEVTGMIGKRFYQKTYASTVYNQNIAGKHFGAIQVTTAAGVCGAVDLLLRGDLARADGIVRAEDIALPLFLANEFGRVFRDERALSGIS
jgi:saccharopine dehydrogenase-like NADP-dependent oxidoreductase